MGTPAKKPAPKVDNVAQKDAALRSAHNALNRLSVLHQHIADDAQVKRALKMIEEALK